MEEQIKAAVKKSLDELRQMQDKLDGLVDDLPEEVTELRQRTEKSLKNIGEKLQEAMRQADDSTQEAQLQAHLGLMEAQDRLGASRGIVDDHLRQLGERSRTLLDEAELKRHLAMMEAQDFWETRGKHLAAEFEKSTETMMSLATRAASDLQVTFKNWNELFAGGGTGTKKK